MKDKIKLKIPEELQNYLKIGKSVEKAINSTVLCRILFLLIDGKNYNKELAKAYYETSNKPPNPKVLAIYLRTLRDAKLIKRTIKTGKKQIYEVNWKGILDILKFRNITIKNKKKFSLSYSLYEHYISSNNDIKIERKNKPVVSDGVYGLYRGKYTKEEIEIISNDLAERFLKPYIEYYVEIEKETGGKLRFEPTKGEWELLILDKSKHFEHIDFNLLSLLEKFDKTLFEIIPLMNPSKIKKSLKLKNLADVPALFTLMCYYMDNQRILHDIYTDGGNPESVILNCFNKEVDNLKEDGA